MEPDQTRKELKVEETKGDWNCKNYNKDFANGVIINRDVFSKGRQESLKLVT